MFQQREDTLYIPCNPRTMTRLPSGNYIHQNTSNKNSKVSNYDDWMAFTIRYNLVLQFYYINSLEKVEHHYFFIEINYLQQKQFGSATFQSMKSSENNDHEHTKRSAKKQSNGNGLDINIENAELPAIHDLKKKSEGFSPRAKANHKSLQLNP